MAAETPRALTSGRIGRLAALTRQEAAEYLGISTRTFDRLRTDVQVPFVIVGRRKKYLQRDLDALILESRTIEGDQT